MCHLSMNAEHENNSLNIETLGTKVIRKKPSIVTNLYSAHLITKETFLFRGQIAKWSFPFNHKHSLFYHLSLRLQIKNGSISYIVKILITNQYMLL